MENKRRYIPAIEKALVALCNQNSWSIPAHDRNLIQPMSTETDNGNGHLSYFRPAGGHWFCSDADTRSQQIMSIW